MRGSAEGSHQSEEIEIVLARFVVGPRMARIDAPLTNFPLVCSVFRPLDQGQAVVSRDHELHSWLLPYIAPVEF